MAAPRFTGQSLRFLRALKRNNRREWFAAHRDDYEAHVRQPMADIIARLADDFREFGPEFVAHPKTSMYRIYRDVRFSSDKAPYKTHAAASFPTRGLPKHEGAGLYFHVSADDVWIGGGMYAPPPPQLHAVREHIAANLTHLRTLVESPGFRRDVGSLEGERLQRVPRGFPKDHERGGISPVQTVSRWPRIRAGLCSQSEVLPGAPHDLPARCAGCSVPQCAVDEIQGVMRHGS
jgi:uncharacterized protein (TIGR02453 family)